MQNTVLFEFRFIIKNFGESVSVANVMPALRTEFRVSQFKQFEFKPIFEPKLPSFASETEPCDKKIE